MNKTIKVEKGDPMYEQFAKLSEEFCNDDTKKTIVAKSEEGKKSDEVPFVEKYGMYFYVAWDAGDMVVYSSEFNGDEFDKAIVNTEENARIFPLGDISEAGPNPVKLEDLEVDENSKEVYCVTTDSMDNGAGIILCDGFMKKLHDKFGDFYLIPSSVHEVMISPKSNEISKDYLNAILKGANDSMEPKVVLSYNVLTYDNGRLHI